MRRGHVHEDPNFEKTAYRVRIAGRGLLAFTLIAAVAGAFGFDRTQFVWKAGAVYLFLLLVFRLAGRRTLGEMTTFDFVLVLIISESTQQALIGNDDSLTTCFLVILTLIGLDQLLAKIKDHSYFAEKWLEGLPVVLVRDGVFLKDASAQVMIDEEDVLSAARQTQGLTALEQIRFAVLEVDGKISVVPRTSAHVRH